MVSKEVVVGTLTSTGVKWQHRLVVLILLAVSWIGLWYHELIRVPESFGMTVEGSMPMLIVAVVAYALWLRARTARLGIRLLLGYGLLMLIGGYLSAPPWAFFHLETQVERNHYRAHVIYALCQLPLVVFVAIRLRRSRSSQIQGQALTDTEPSFGTAQDF